MLAATPQPISGRSLAQRGSSYSAATAAADERWGGPVGQEHSAQPSSSSASAGGARWLAARAIHDATVSTSLAAHSLIFVRLFLLLPLSGLFVAAQDLRAQRLCRAPDE